MPIELLIENVPDELAALLELRAQRNQRTLEDELLAIFEEAVRNSPPTIPDQSDKDP